MSPPAVRPLIKRRWRNRNSTIIGSIMIMPAALVRPQFWPKLLWKARKLVVIGLRLLSWMKRFFYLALPKPEVKRTGFGIVSQPHSLDLGRITVTTMCSSCSP